MTLDEYQGKAHETSLNTEFGDNDLLAYPIAGMASEAAEVLGKWAKIQRDQGGQLTNDDRMAILKECGDVLWMVAETATQLNVGLGVVARMNLDKLADRQRRGVIGGSGDDR